MSQHACRNASIAIRELDMRLQKVSHNKMANDKGNGVHLPLKSLNYSCYCISRVSFRSKRLGETGLVRLRGTFATWLLLRYNSFFGNSGNVTLLHIHQCTTDGNMRLASQKLKT